MYAIEAQNVGKLYKNGIQALCNLNIKVKTGEIYTLLGENGAEKSTLIKILTTFLKASMGNIRVLERDIVSSSTFICSNIACVFQQTSIDTHLSLQENMMSNPKIIFLDEPTVGMDVQSRKVMWIW